jgi:hypothetical protein
MLFERGVPFRHDWKHVITPVVDFLLDRPDVDPKQIVLYGISQAGYWVPRALAFEHRIATAIADPGVYDVFEPWAKAAPPELRQLLDSGDKKDFDRFFEEGMKEATPAERQNWEWRAKPYGLQSPFDVFTAAPPVQPHRCSRPDHHAIADHRSRRRAVLAGPTKAAVRQTSRCEATHAIHCF